MSNELAVKLDWAQALKFALTTLPTKGPFLVAVSMCAVTVPSLLLMNLPEPMRGLLLQVVSSFMVCGYWTILLAVVRGESPSFGQLFSKAGMFWKFLISNLLCGIMIVLGFILLIVPGLIIMVRVGLFPPAMTDRNLGPLEAIKWSWQITRGHVKALLLLMLITTLIAGVLALVLGIPMGILVGLILKNPPLNTVISVSVMILVPVLLLPTMLCLGHVYQQLNPGAAEPTALTGA